MSSGMWMFKNLPESEYENVKKLYEEGKIVDLIRIHDKYVLSHNPDYCCSHQGFMPWVKLGIERGWR